MALRGAQARHVKGLAEIVARERQTYASSPYRPSPQPVSAPQGGGGHGIGWDWLFWLSYRDRAAATDRLRRRGRWRLRV